MELRKLRVRDGKHYAREPSFISASTLSGRLLSHHSHSPSPPAHPSTQRVIGGERLPVGVLGLRQPRRFLVGTSGGSAGLVP